VRRQVEQTAKFCAEHGLGLVDTIRDEGLSGYHGVNRSRGALGRLVQRIQAGEVPAGDVIIVEALDRLSRQLPRIAQEQFLSIINAEVDIVTLVDQQWYSAKSLDAGGSAQLFMSIGVMIGAHAESLNKSKRITESWTIRRTDPATNIVPSWFVRVDGKLLLDADGQPKIDSEKVEIIRRIAHDLLNIGLNRLATRLNTEGVPPISGRKPSHRAETVWDMNSIRRVIQGRQVLGEQEDCYMRDNKRVRTGVFVKRYAAALTEEEWQAANAAITGRKHGGVTYGRNVTRMTNLFGDLAKCSVCGGRMKIKRKGDNGEFCYLGCPAASFGKCTAKKYHRLDHAERRILEFFEKRALGDWRPAPRIDPTTTLVAQIATARADVAKLERRYATMFERYGDHADPSSLVVRNLAKLDADHKAKVAEIKELGKQLADIKGVEPMDEQLAFVRRLARVLDELTDDDRLAARTRIAAALPRILSTIEFKPNGDFVAMGEGWTISFHSDASGTARWIMRMPKKLAVTAQARRRPIWSSRGDNKQMPTDG
jgi:DNA invertase Pin-like site-specific DNA recombinase